MKTWQLRMTVSSEFLLYLVFILCHFGRGQDFQGCCLEHEVSEECSRHCAYPLPKSISVFPGSCLNYVNHMLFCVAGGRNHTNCCQRQGVQTPCLVVCSGEKISPLDIQSNIKCLSDASRIGDCFTKTFSVRLPPSIKRGPRSKSIIFGNNETVEIDCVAEGVQPVRYAWKKNGRPLFHIPNITASVDGTLTISQATTLDEGSYQCLATNQYGTAASIVTHLQMATHNSGIGRPTVLQHTVLEGSSFYIQATSLKGNFPKPIKGWEIAYDTNDRRPTPLQFSTRIQMADNGDLYFAYATLEDNLGGRLYASTMYNDHLDIKSTTSFTNLTVLRDQSGLQTFAPHLAFSSEVQTVALIGGSVSFRCFFGANPEANISWRRAISRPLPAGRYQLKHFNTELVISNITVSDEGNYTCNGSNAMGQTGKNLQMRVEAVPVFQNLADGPININATEGESVTFNCSAFAIPAAQIVWFLNGEIINVRYSPPRFLFSKNMKSLTIVNVCRDCTDRISGTDLMGIQCNASNIHGYAFASGYLNVLAKTKVVIAGARSAIFVDDEVKNVQFKCRATSDPSTLPTVRWYKREDDGEHFLREDSNIRINNGSLIIHVSPDGTIDWKRYEGDYSCIGDNRYSRDVGKVTIRRVNAELVQKFINGSSTEGSIVQFFCSYNFHLPITNLIDLKFQWYLNDLPITNTAKKQMIQTGRYLNNSKSFNSTLTFDPVSISDSGIIRCSANFFFLTAEATISRASRLEVIIRPRISIYPLTLDVFDSQQFVLSCTVTNVLNENAVNFIWYQDGVLISNTSGSRTSTLQSALTTEKSPVKFSCMVETVNGTGVNLATSNVNVLKKEDQVCPHEDKESLSWPITKVNNMNYQPCPGNTTGICSRRCSTSNAGSPLWLSPNCDSCVDVKFADVLEKIDRLEYGIGLTAENVARIANSLSNWTNETSGLAPGDLNASVTAVDRLAVLREDHNIRASRNEIMSVVQTISNMLQPKNSKAWETLIKVNQTAAAALMRSADVYGNSLALTINQTDHNTPVREVAENMVLEAISFGIDNLPAEIRFPSSLVSDKSRDDSITLPLSAHDLIWSGSPPSVKIWSSYYHNIEAYLPTTNHSNLDSRILSLSVENKTKLQQPVTVTLHHNTTQEMNRKRHCVFWNFDSVGGGNWSKTGCRVKISDLNYTVCICDHLTNFALLMSLAPSDDAVLSIISTIGCVVSVVALILTVIVYVVTWKQSKSDQATVLLNLCVALIIANVIFLAGADKVEPKDGCIAVAVLLHYFFLAAFFIMLAEGVELLLYVIFVFHVRRKIETTMLIVAAWVLPLVIVAISLGVTKTVGYGNEKSCWLAVEDGLIWAFIGPALFIFGVNLVIIVIVIRRISVARLRSTKTEKGTNIRGTLWNVSVICPVLGIAWIFGILSVASSSVVFQYIFAIANSLQGLLIFIFHALFHNQKINAKVSTLFTQIMSHSQSTPSVDLSQHTRTKEAVGRVGTAPKGTDHALVNYYDQLEQKERSDVLQKQNLCLSASATFSSSNQSNTDLDANTSNITAEVHTDTMMTDDSSQALVDATTTGQAVSI